MQMIFQCKSSQIKGTEELFRTNKHLYLKSARICSVFQCSYIYITIFFSITLSCILAAVSLSHSLHVYVIETSTLLLCHTVCSHVLRYSTNTHMPYHLSCALSSLLTLSVCHVLCHHVLTCTCCLHNTHMPYHLSCALSSLLTLSVCHVLCHHALTRTYCLHNTHMPYHLSCAFFLL
jgi:hypothetical protein